MPNLIESEIKRTKLFKKTVRTLASVGLGITSLISPIDTPKKVSAEQGNLSQSSVLLDLHGKDNKGNLRILLVGQNGPTQAMMQEVVEDLGSLDPMQEVMAGATVKGLLNAPDLGCNQNAICNWGAVNNLTKHFADKGDIFHETMVVIRNNDEGGGTGHSFIPSQLAIPDIYSPSAILRPVKIDNSGSRQSHAGTVIHEFLHAWAGQGHDGGDIMERKGHFINEQRKRYIKDLIAISPHNYLTPKNEIKTVAASLGFKSELITPIGTTQQKRWIRPANNDGSDVTLLRNQEGSFEIPAPKIGVGNYILLPDMTYTWREWSSNYPTSLVWTSPQWEQVEGWPGIFFPNPAAEINIRTPKRDSSGITAISPKNGEIIDVSQTVLRWVNRDLDVFYYEVRASKDCTFNTDPQTATAPVWHNLIHGGETKPINSWQTPQLELNTEYCWETRPRIQGDGTPVKWSQTFRFKTPASGGVKSVYDITNPLKTN